MSADYDLHEVPARAGGSFVNLGPFAGLTAQELEEVAPGSCRMFDIAGVLLTCVKREGGYWKVLTRSGIPPMSLAGQRSAPRGRVDPLDIG